MSTTKKVLTIIFSILIIGAFAFTLTWGIINWSKVRDGMSGSGLYTQDDVQNAYEDGFNKALSDKEEYEKLINSYKDTITTQTDLISQYTSEANILNNSIKDYQEQINGLTEQKSILETQVATLNNIKSNNEETISDLNGQIAGLASEILELQANKDENENRIAQLNTQIDNLQSLNSQLQSTNEMNLQTISGLNNQIAALNNQISELKHQMQENSTTVNTLTAKIAELQKSVKYYENYIATLEQGDQVVATFEFAGSVYNIQVVNKNSLLAVTTPTSTAYVIFNGWTVDGQAIDLATYRITQNTRIVADVTYKYEVNFIVEGENYGSQIVLKGETASIPAAPTKSGYVFDGWSLDGNIVDDIENYEIMQNVTFTARFTKLYSVIFKYEETTLANKTVRSGEYATAPEAVSTAYKVFNGWKINGTTVDVSKYRITSDTVFVADITYKYDVKFMSDGKVHSTQIVEKNSRPVAPTDPKKDKYVFVGWTLDGTNAVDVTKQTVTSNMTFTALFRVDKFTVKFNNGANTIATQEVDNGGYATKPDFDLETFMGWTVDGNTVVDLSTYKITENTTFTAKHGSWKLLSDDQQYVEGAWNCNSIDIQIDGLKVGDKIKITANYIKVNISYESDAYWFNTADGNGCYGWEYTYDGEWYQLQSDMDFGYSGGKELSSLKPFESTLGKVNYEMPNTFVIKLSCKKDGVLTVEWSDNAGFYVETMTMWYLYVVR